MRAWLWPSVFVVACFLVAATLVGVAAMVRSARQPAASPRAREVATHTSRPGPPTVHPVTPAKPPEPPPAVRPRATAPRDTDSVGDFAAEIPMAAVVDDSLWVAVVVQVGGDRKGTLRGWRSWGLGGRGTSLRDDRGNDYKQAPFDLIADGLLSDAMKARLKQDKMGFGPGPIYPDQPRAEMILFERPVTNAAYLDLDLDARGVGLKEGTFRFRIPRSMWAE